MTTKQAAMLTLAESCENFEESTMLLAGTVERMYAEDAKVPAKLGAFLESLRLDGDASREIDEEDA